MSSLPARMKKIKFKMKVLDCSQDYSHYKSVGIFPEAQGQLTLQSTVRAGQISNSFKTLWLSSLLINFSDAQGQITLELEVVFGRNLNSSKLSCMSSLPAGITMID